MLLGGAGFIGLNLASVLRRYGHEVHVADRVGRPVRSNPPMAQVAGYHVVDINDTDSLLSTIDEFRIECVIGLTSSLIPSSGLMHFEVELKLVISPMFRLVEHLSKRQIGFVYLSSGGTVYGANNNDLVAETEPLCPINYYGYSKVLFEQYLAFAGKTLGLRYLILRPSNPFGPYQNPNRGQGLVAVAVAKVLSGQTIEVWGDGSIVRDYIWIENLTEATAALLSKDDAWGCVFNIGSGRGYSVQDLLALIGELTNKRIRITYRQGRSVDVPRLVLDISRLQAAIDFEPLDLRAGLSLYLKGYG